MILELHNLTWNYAIEVFILYYNMARWDPARALIACFIVFRLIISIS